MELFPAPFTLGSSSAKLTDVIPAIVHFDPQNRENVVVGCHIGGVYYSNRNQSQMRDANFATVVYNHDTDELVVIQKKPEFLSPCFEEPERVQPKEPSATDRAALTNTFGSVKRQRMLKESEQHAEHRAAVVEATAITKAMHGQKMLKKDNMDAQSAVDGVDKIDERVRLLPPFSQSASSAALVYPLNKLLPARVTDALKTESNTLSTAPVSTYQTWTENGVYQKCVLDRIMQLSSLSRCSTGSEENASGTRLRIAQCLTYLSHLLALYQLSSNDVQRKNPLPDTPPALVKHLLKEFTVMINRGDSARFKVRTITPMLRDRLIYHVLALVLHCDNFSTYLDDLTVDLRMSSERLRKYFAYMGCKVVKEDVKGGNSDTPVTRLKAILTVPLNFPERNSYKTR